MLQVITSIGLFLILGAIGWQILSRLSTHATLQSINRTQAPSCGKCGYPTQGISTRNCPECGADLREVGIVTSKQSRYPAGNWLSVILFTVAILILRSALTPLVESFAPRYAQYHVVWDFESTANEYLIADLTIEAEQMVRGSKWPSIGNGVGYGWGTSMRGTPQTFFRLDGIPSPKYIKKNRACDHTSSKQHCFMAEWQNTDQPRRHEF